MTVRTRFAPSPTGHLHIGSVRTALYAWLLARHHGGEYILRIEDTDRERSTQEAIDAILDGLSWLGIDADEGPVYQSRRFDRHAEVLQRLLDQDLAYRCYCSREEIDAMRAEAQAKGLKPRYDGRCRDGSRARDDVAPVVRFKNPLEGQVVVDDLVKGRITFNNAELDDLILARSDGSPTYNFVVVVDDTDMRISHVVRGDDHLNNTPRQINLFRALRTEPPAFAHLPMIHGPDDTKLSKRHGAVDVLEYRKMGFLPEALLNYLLRLGWSRGDQEIFTLDEMIDLFGLEAVSRSAARFDPLKLLWVNHQHIQSVDAGRLAELLASQLRAQGLDPANGPPLPLTVKALSERSQTVLEMAERANCYYGEFEEFDAKSAKAHLRPVARNALAAVRETLEILETWTEESAQAAVETVADRLELKLGKVAQPLRVALTAKAASPGIGTTLMLVGRERALLRIDRALAYIDARAAGQ
ncbi:glutamate--tRNA ligase [Candidatus Rariloculus sp.]|uniref:glutamate--tRNA ligase n=1 Tax=Candidatus Rariloculus sp. TaxID=3101265 RepID=UPI003D14C6AA